MTKSRGIGRGGARKGAGRKAIYCKFVPSLNVIPLLSKWEELGYKSQDELINTALTLFKNSDRSHDKRSLKIIPKLHSLTHTNPWNYRSFSHSHYSHFNYPPPRKLIAHLAIACQILAHSQLAATQKQQGYVLLEAGILQFTIRTALTLVSIGRS